MSPVNLTVRLQDFGVKDRLRKTDQRIGNLRPVLNVIGEIIQTSVQKNFEVGGRPQKWTGLALSTIKQRQKERKWPGQILVRRGFGGGLLSAIAYRTGRRRVTLSANKVYAAIHHFGGRAGRGRKVTIPKRPFMIAQREDRDEIQDAIRHFLFK